MIKPARIFLADDHSIFREGLRHIMAGLDEYEVIGETGDGREALETIEKVKPDMVILDISMPGMTGIEVARQLRKYHSDIRIIILTRHNNEEYLNQCMKYGIHGYVLKDDACDELLRALREVCKGNVYISPRMVGPFISDHIQRHSHNTTESEESVFQTLSDREREILKLIAEGKTNIEIGSKLFISDKTVKAHRANIMKKLGIHKVADLVRYALQNGLIE